ncbi:MAG: MFS transporter [Pseudomonadota bacterium]
MLCPTPIQPAGGRDLSAYLSFLRDNARWLGAGFLLSLLSTFGQTAFVAVFAGDITARFDLGQGSWGAIYALGTTVAAMLMLWTGTWADRHPLAPLSAWVLAGLGLACLGMALSPALWLLPLLIVGLRLFGQGMLSHLAYVAMARWFAARRGQALAIAALGFTIGQAVLPLAFTAAMVRVGAEALWLLAAAICLGAIWPMRRLLAQPRVAMGAEAAATEAPGRAGRHWTRADVLRDRLFWMLLPALMGPPAFGTAFFFFQVHLPEVKGWSQVGFVALFPVVMAVSTLTTFASGALIDRVGASRLLPVALLPMAAGFLWLGWASTLGAALPAVILLALTMGAMATVPVSLWAEQFGTRHLGAIKAAAMAAMTLGTALGPGLVGALIDRGVDFPGQMPWISCYFVISAALAWAGLRRERSAELR